MRLVERAEPADRAAIEALLASSELPVEGLEAALPLAVVARDGDAILGCAAVEPYGAAGLLRSVAVAAGERGTGIGRAVVAAAEALAADAGIAELFLLTETAEEWFPRLGYVRVTRADVPAAMLASPELTTLCPETSAVLRKRLASGAPDPRRETDVAAPGPAAHSKAR